MGPLRAKSRCQRASVALLAALAAGVTLWTVLVQRQPAHPVPLTATHTGGPFHYPVWAEYTAPNRPDAWYNATCFGGRLQPGLAALGDNLLLWRAADEPHCRQLAARFDDVFTVEYRTANVTLPPPFRAKVSGWMGGSEALLAAVERQRILLVTDNLSLHSMAFNPGRARRPQPRGSGPGPLEQLRTQAEGSRASCDFCRHDTLTAPEEDAVSSEHAVVVGNTFKLDGSHALVLSRVHSPLELSDAAAADMLSLADRWCRQVQGRRPERRFPTLIWDMGLHAGMSQVHPHLHVMLSPGHYAGEVERLRVSARLYWALHPAENYFSTVAEVHAALGLTARLGSAVAVAVVNPLLDMELWVMDTAAGVDFRRLYALAVRALERHLGRFCHSAGLALPALGEPAGRLPALARLVSRGDCTAVRADVSSLELFALSSISVDPYDVIREVRATVAEAAGR